MSMGVGGEEKVVMNDINVTPMVDVMLVLLIIFMVVTPTLLAGFQVTLPTGSNLKERPEEEGRVTMGIDVNGGYYFNGKPMRREDAVSLLTAAFAAKPEDKVLFLKADINLPYSEVEAAFQIARSSGARVVAAVSDLPTTPLAAH
jgi:biopolymer transport protein ExbD